jgi:tetratricopeptide (TPR) repeat protein
VIAMSDEPPSGPDTLPFALAAAIDRACDDFEAKWMAGLRPRIEEVLGDHEGSVRAALMRDLLASELECRRRRGESPDRAEYRDRFPDHGELIDLAFDDAGFGCRTSRDRSGRRSVEPVPLAHVDGYEILDELGRGGMGVVYLARHRQLGRLVALKMVLAGEYAAPAALARLRAEARAAARLQHPGIVQIFEVGEQEKRPFVALEYVAGGSLARRMAAAPLPAREAAHLVEAVARAMQAAHQQGIVHRDLKPSNVLLTSEGDPKVTDFGLAKTLDDDAGLTQSESILGSPSYMAPEQAQGRAKHVGPAADIYALGAILYEAVTGRPPFKAATPLLTLEQVKTIDPVPPTRLVPGLSRDIETICLTCLRKEPVGRYEAASALADDLGRFLRGEPIKARPVSPAERAWRWTRRKPAVAGLIAALGLAMAFGFAGMTMLWLRAERLRRIADANLADARAAVDECFTIADKDPVLRRPGLQPVRHLLLRAALKYYEGFAERQKYSASLQAELARNYTRVGVITEEIGSASEALAAHRQAQVLLERQLSVQRDEPTLCRDLARCHHDIAVLSEALGKHAEAFQSIERALTMRERLAAERPNQFEYVNDLAQSLQLTGDLLLETGREAEALRTYERATVLRERLMADHPGSAVVRHDLAGSLVNLGLALRGAGMTTQAMQSLTRATEILESVAASDPESDLCQDSLAKALSNLGVLQRDLGRTDEASRSWSRAAVVIDRLVAENPRVTQYRRSMVVVHMNTAVLHCNASRLAEAELSLGRASEAATALAALHPDVAEFQSDLATIHNNLGGVAFSRNQAGAAFASWERAVTLRERLVAEHPEVLDWQRDLASSLNNLGIAQRDLGRIDEALRSWTRAAELSEQLVAQHPSSREYRRGLAEVLGALGGLQRRRGLHNKASRSLGRAREIGESLAEPTPTDLYTLAYVEAQCAALIGKGRTQVTPAERAERQSLSDRAMATLRRAVHDGFRDLKQLEHDADLDPLRSRADFRNLIMDLAFPLQPFAP